jgi:hypothetical protein
VVVKGKPITGKENKTMNRQKKITLKLKLMKVRHIRWIGSLEDTGIKSGDYALHVRKIDNRSTQISK